MLLILDVLLGEQRSVVLRADTNEYASTAQLAGVVVHLLDNNQYYVLSTFPTTVPCPTCKGCGECCGTHAGYGYDRKPCVHPNDPAHYAYHESMGPQCKSCHGFGEYDTVGVLWHHLANEEYALLVASRLHTGRAPHSYEDDPWDYDYIGVEYPLS